MAPQSQCVYCLASKPASAFNVEHVLPQSFGRFQGAPTLAYPRKYRVCAACNQHLGDSVDFGLARNSWEGALRIVRHETLGDPRQLKYDRIDLQLPSCHPLAPLLLQLTRRSDYAGPTCTPHPQLRVTRRNGTKICVPEWKLLEDLPGLLKDNPQSGVELFCSTADEGAFERIEGKARQAGLTNLQWRTIAEGRRDEVESLDANLSFTIDTLVARAIAKIGYEYFFWRMEGQFDHLIRFEALEWIREFIFTGAGDWRSRVIPGNEPVLADETRTIRHAGCHLLTLKWGSTGVVAEVALFNDIVYRVKVCEALSPIQHCIEIGHHFDLNAMTATPLVMSQLLHPPLPRPAVVRKAARRQ